MKGKEMAILFLTSSPEVMSKLKDACQKLFKDMNCCLQSHLSVEFSMV